MDFRSVLMIPYYGGCLFARTDLGEVGFFYIFKMMLKANSSPCSPGCDRLKVFCV